MSATAAAKAPPIGPAIGGLFVASIALSAFLLFLVQPIIAKQLLPWFGGSSAVWITCLVFFQVMLLAGYTYTHLLTTRLSACRQGSLHIALLLASLAFLPIVPATSLKPTQGTEPGWQVTVALLATVGLPYFLLATTGPLLQKWVAPRLPEGAVYRLFALSNLGSLVGLLAFPFAIEPFMDSATQSYAWSGGYVAFVACAAGLSLHVRRRGMAVRAEPSRGVRVAGPSLAQYATWLALAALGSVVLLGTSAHLTQNIASVPFLWVLPLGLYLASFVIVFDGRGGRGWYDRRWGLPAMLVATVLMAAGLAASQGALHVLIAVPLYCAGLLAVCVFCHGELAQRKPADQHLTHFYLSLAAGGALGGLAVALGGPYFYDAFFELPTALLLIAVAGTAVLWSSEKQRSIALVGTVATCYFGLAYAATLTSGSLRMERNFYGAMRVQQERVDGTVVRRLVHGVIAHGEEAVVASGPPTPRAYFSPTSGGGRAIRAAQAGGPVDVGVIGLGVGTLAAYARTGDRFRFYELDPDVLHVARTSFSYLEHAAGTVEHVLGDARLSMERELGTERQGRFDVLVLDAFSSDAIPVHLLTREALQLYLAQLKAGGLLAMHLSNKFLDLTTVAAALASAEGLDAKLVDDRPPAGSGAAPSLWVLMKRGVDSWPPEIAHLADVSTPATVAAWTDSYSSLFPALRTVSAGELKALVR